MALHRILYIPIEEALRDLEARLLLTHFALRDDWTVVVGQQWLLHAASELLPAGVFFFKGANQRQTDWMRNARRWGHACVAIEEEATAIAEPLVLERQMARDCPELLDLYLAQGAHHARALTAAHPGLEGRVREVGVSRFDLLRPAFLARRENRVGTLRQAFDPFILINTNFGYANSHWGSPERFFDTVVVGNGLIDTANPAEIQLFADRLEFEQRTMASFVDLIDSLSGQATVVLRPHLAEELTTWTALHERHGWGDGVKIIREGPAIDWILASRLLIQNSCTTGIEAEIMGHPVVSYVPFVNPFLSCYIGNEAMPATVDRQAVVKTSLKAISSDPEDLQVKRPEPGAFDIYYTRPDTDLVTENVWRAIFDGFNGASLSGSEAIFGLDYLELGNQTEISKTKFSTDARQVQTILESMGNVLGRELAIKGRVVGDNLFALAPG